MGASKVPLGDLSVSDEPSDESIAAFLFSNSMSFILPCDTLLQSKTLCKANRDYKVGIEKKERVLAF